MVKFKKCLLCNDECVDKICQTCKREISSIIISSISEYIKRKEDKDKKNSEVERNINNEQK